MRYKYLSFLFFFIVFYSFGQENKKILSLQECIEITQNNNLSVRRSQLNLDNQKINYQQSKWQRYPNFNLGLSYGYNWGRGIDPVTNQFTTQQISFNGLSGSSSVPLISGLQVSNSIKQIRKNVQASRFDLEKTKNDVALNISLIFLNIVLNKELVQNARYQLESSQQQLERTEQLVSSGALAVSNELQLTSQVATNEVNLITSENNLDLALLDLKQNLLLPPAEQVDVSVGDLEVNEDALAGVTITNIYNNALDAQPEIKAANLRIESALFGLNVSKSGFYPNLNLTGSFGTNFSSAAIERVFSDTSFITSPTNLYTPDAEQIYSLTPQFETQQTPFSTQYKNNFSQRLTLGLSIPILNNYRVSSDVQRAKIAIQQAEIAAIEQQNILYQNIESAYRSTVAAIKTYTASKKQVESLEETFRSLEQQYNLGASNFTDYQVANNNLFSAKTDLARAKYDLIFRLKILDFYQGKEINF